MGGKPPQMIERQTAATPIAEDILRVLQGELSQGAFGTGVGPLQREAGTAFRQFISSGGVPQGETLEGMIPALEAVHRRGVERNVADLREGMGIMGSRMGTPLTTGEGRLRAGMEQDWRSQLAQIANAVAANNLQRHQLNLGAASQMFGMGQQAQRPFMEMAGQGILPPELFWQPNPWMQILQGAVGAGGDIGKAYVGAKVG